MKRTVLLIDDDQEEYELFCHTLEKYNLNVSCIHAWECNRIQNVIKGKEIHWVFLDFNLPKHNGYECLHQIKKISPLQNVPVYMFSASYIPKETKKLCLEAGAVMWLNKPDDIRAYFKIFDEIFGSEVQQ